MPYTVENPPATIENLPKAAQAIWIRVFNSAFRAFEGSEDEKDEVARKAAWAAVKRDFRKTEGGKWVPIDGEKGAKRTFTVGERIVVEMNLGLDGYSALSFGAIDEGAGIFMNEGTNPETSRREAAALYFDKTKGWTVGKANTWARRWAQEHQSQVKRVGIEVETAEILIPFHRGWLQKAVNDPSLARNRIAFAEVLIPYEVDTQGDMATPDEIEAACHRFMEKQAIGLQHVTWDNIGAPVENFIAREGDPDFTPGAWVMGVKFSEEAWQLVLNDEITGLSIGGMWDRVPVIENEAMPTGTHG